MNLNILSPEAMIANSNPWLTNATVRAALSNHTLGTGILDQMQGAHDQLTHVASQRLQLAALLSQLTAVITDLDIDHDRNARGLHGFLSAHAEVADNEQSAKAFKHARELLFPDDLQVVRRSYIQQHGRVLEVEERITQEVRDLLSQTQAGGRTLLDIYNAWIAAGVQLGERMQERARLRASIGDSESDASIDIRAARSAWIQVVHIFLSIVDVLPLNDEERRLVLAPLDDAIADAQRNRARVSSAVEDIDADDDSSDSQAPAEEPIEPDAALEPAEATVAATGTGTRR